MSMLRPKFFATASRRWSSTDLKAVIASKIPAHLEKIKKFRKEHNKSRVCDVIVNQVYGGMRGIISLICETSHLDPEEGIRFRGYSIPEVKEKLPKYSDEPLPEGIFWLLCTGDIPTTEQVETLSRELALRAELPPHVCKFLNTVPPHVHPMAQLSAACTILNTESEFLKAYNKGVHKTKLWEYTYDDAINLMGKITPIAALIYRNSFKNRADIGVVDTSKDWSCNFCRMLGYDDINFVELMRLYLTIHCDHESGNVSSHTCHLVGSALSDPFLSYAASMNGLAGPLHGLANQEVLTFIEGIHKELGDNPSEDKLKDFIMNWLKKGVVPGYGHAVLRKTDPRFIVQRQFAEKHLPDDPLFKIVSGLYKVVPPILKGLGKVQNPWPNVDAHSGILLSHFGLAEKKYYTVLFAVSRLMGVMANLIWDRAMLLPIERPKSITSDMLIARITGGGGGSGGKGKGDSKGGKKIKVC